MVKQVLTRIEQLERTLLEAMDQPMSHEEAAKYLKISEAHLYMLTSKGLVRYYKPGRGKNVFYKSDLDRYIKGISAKDQGEESR